MKFLHLADCHLDAPFIDLGRAVKKSNIRRFELKETFTRAIEFAKSQNVDLVLISGDLFEHRYVDKATVKFINDRFSQISDIKIFISPGNHDPCVHNSYYNTFNWSENVFIFDMQFRKVYLPRINTNVYGVGFSDFYLDKCLINEICEEDKDKINILVSHGTLDIQASEQRYHPISSKYISSIGFDYCALGHIHKTYMDEKNNIYYPGSLEPLGFDEMGKHGVILGEITKEYRNICFYPIALREYFVSEVDVSGLSTVEDVLDRVKSLIDLEKSTESIYKIIFTGNIENLNIDCRFIEECLKEYFYFVRVEDKTTFSYPLDVLESEQTLKGLFVRKMNQLINKAEHKDREMLIKALNYGLDALTKGEVRL